MQDITPGATFLDGLSNKRRSVQLRTGVLLEIVEEGTVTARWPWDSVRRADTAGEGLRLRSTQAPDLARLDIADPAYAKTIASFCPNLMGSSGTGRTSNMRIVAWSLAAVASIVFVGLVGVPYVADRLTPLLPHSFDQRLGEVVDGQVKVIFGSKVCDEPEGKKAYNKLVSKLVEAGGMKVAVNAAVLNSGVPNAVALPGGKVYFFKALLEKAKNPDEIAGVLAHELGHVQHRDSMRKLLQAGGTSFLLGLLFGDVTGSGAVILATQTLLDSSYSRQAEFNADGFAIDVMKRLGRSTVPMGELLVRVTGKQGGGKLDLFASHPFSQDRLARMKKEMPVHTGPPLLDDAEWNALKGICALQPAAKSNDAGGTAGKGK